MPNVCPKNAQFSAEQKTIFPFRWNPKSDGLSYCKQLQIRGKNKSVRGRKKYFTDKAFKGTVQIK